MNPNLSSSNLVKVINLADSDAAVNWQSLLLHAHFSTSVLPRILETWLHITLSMNFHAETRQEELAFCTRLFYLNYCFHVIQVRAGCIH